MDEATKTSRLRGTEFIQTYFSGRVIDIGCGPDLVVPHAEPFDLEQGDAQRILDYRAAESFDCVHSSHCLEHMRDVKSALTQWWALVKPNGYLVVVVPHEELYEQGAWPSLFNTDHKAMFNLRKRNLRSKVSYDLLELARGLPNVTIIDASVQDQGLDYSLLRRATGFRRALFVMASWRERLFRRLMSRGLPLYRLSLAIDRFERLLGKPIDQTLGPALAQIQLVAQKQPATQTGSSGMTSRAERHVS